MRVIRSIVGPGHPDYDVLIRIQNFIYAQVGGQAGLHEKVPELIREAIDFVIDPIRTGRTSFDHLDNVEKTFIGLKTEHFVRDLLDVPKGIRDLVIDGMDVDIKNTTGSTWMIPPETYREEEPCIVIASDEHANRCWFGLFVARRSYLTKPNRDQKRSVSAAARQHILWLLEGVPYPRSRWAAIDMLRFRELRKIRGGTKRVAAFFSENLRKAIHRSVVQALLFDQHDYMKRLRENSGARDRLRPLGIALLSGKYDRAAISDLMLPRTGIDEHIAVKPKNEEEAIYLRSRSLIG